MNPVSKIVAKIKIHNFSGMDIIHKAVDVDNKAVPDYLFIYQTTENNSLLINIHTRDIGSLKNTVDDWLRAVKTAIEILSIARRSISYGRAIHNCRSRS